MEEKKISLPKLVKAFRALRDERSKLKEDYKKEDKSLEVKQDKIKEVLLTHCRDNDVNSVKTDEGTFTRTKKVNYWTSDWENLHKFILEHQIPDILQKRISQANLKEWLEDENNKGLLPKGLQVDAEYTITIQKPRGT
jgi:hypothetical protein|tara:strand:- start:1264 stop:1677 length:414 start_codon:yes stop_codon:yes gene_type:complete